MAINIPIVTDFNSKGLQDASNAFTNFRTKIGEADGAMGKMKAGFGAAMDTMKANAGAFAAAAGAAILGFAVKAIGEFQDLALAAGKFADSTNLAVEEASAFIEVAGDLGIESSVLEKAINKMNIAIGKGSKEFNALGVEVAYNDKGLVDTNETFLRTVDALNRLSDGTDRSRYASAVFGKSWMEMSEIISMGAGNLRTALDSVSDAKIINPEELKRARDLRDAQDGLRDAFEDVTITIGQNLVPALSQMIKTVTPLLELMGPLSQSIFAGADASASYGEQVANNNIQLRITRGAMDLFNKILGRNKEETDDAGESLEFLNNRLVRAQMGAQQLRYATLQLGNSVSALDEDTNGLIDTFDSLLAQFDRDELVTGLKNKFEEFQASVLEALGKATPEAARKSEAAMRDLVREMGQVAQSARLTSQEQVKIVALLEKGQYDAAYQELLRQLAAVPKQIPIEFIGKVSGIPVPAGQTPSETIGRSPGPGFGGLPNVGGGKGGGTITTPTRPIVGAFSLMPTAAGPNVVVNVAGSVTTENDLIEGIRKGLVNAQRNGSGLVYSNF
jgi:tetratricopeptide (TPR) repeat protein